MASKYVYPKITADTSKIQRFFKRLEDKTGKRLSESMDRWGKQVLVPTVLQTARSVGIKPFRSNGMFNRTRWEQTGHLGVLIMPVSGVHQDRAAPHWVSNRPGAVKPMLQAWMQAHWGQRYGKFYFRPKPFINTGVRNSINRAQSFMRAGLRLAIRESKQ
jgi:hypothetical protein